MFNQYDYVLDCSVAMSWFFEDEVDDYSEQALLRLTNGAIVPTIWSLEVTNVLLMAVKRKRMTATIAASMMDRIANLPIDTATAKPMGSIASTFQLGLETGLTSYDASYLELALTRKLPLATKDKELRKVAKKNGVKIWQ